MIDLETLYEHFKQHPVISADSRNCPKGALFFALKGETFDGNDFIEQALHAGASFAIGDRPTLKQDPQIIQVDNVLQTLQALARHHRRQMPARVIAVTGTNGKTTTKELIAAALSSQYSTLYTQGNLNNQLGVPLTLLQLKPEHQFAVIEMGASRPGEISDLCRIAEPNAGLITNLGRAHLEGFGSFEGVVRAKVELYDFLRKTNGTSFVSADNLLLMRLSAAMPSVVTYGSISGVFVQGWVASAIPVLTLAWDGGTIVTQLAGSYNFENVIAAVCVAKYYGVSEHKIRVSIENHRPTSNRSQRLETGRNHLIIDAYNANPDSMKAALNSFAAVGHTNKMLILGEMKELGAYTREAHQRLTDSIPPYTDAVFLVGIPYFSCRSLQPSWRLFPNTAALVNYLKENPVRGYSILLKGSRSNRLEEVVPYL
jgi:UDP-N-acetylmuramoyl-tripeptide--D-alanyl-D-alanine ligase